MTIPNKLTLLRLLLIPVFIVVFYLPYSHSNLFACVIFILAAVTDILDGYYARTYNMTSKFGDYYDHIKDLFINILLLLVFVKTNNFSKKTLTIIFIITTN